MRSPPNLKRLAGIVVIAAATALCSPALADRYLDEDSGGLPSELAKFKPGYKLQDLISKKSFKAASDHYFENKAFFAANLEKYRSDINKIAAHYNDKHLPELKAAIGSIDESSQLSAEADWQDIKQSLGRAQAALARYDDEPILSEPGYQSRTYESLKSKVAASSRRMEQSAPKAFEEFNHFEGLSFFDAFPVPLDQRGFTGKHFGAIRNRLAAAGTLQLEHFLATYKAGNEFPPPALTDISNIYIGKAMRRQSGDQGVTLTGVLGGLADAKKLGFAPDTVPGVGLSLVEVPADDAIEANVMDFQAEIDADLPFDHEKFPFDGLPERVTTADSDYSVVVVTSDADIDRQVTRQESISSRYQSGTRRERNPAFDIARANYLQAQTDLATAKINASSSSTSSPAAALIVGILQLAVIASAKSKVDNALAAMSSTPQTLEIPVYESYEFKKRHFRATKDLSLTYYVVDHRNSRYFRSKMTTTAERKFEVVYGLNSRDVSLSAHKSGTQTEDEISAWERSPLKVPLSALVDDYVKNGEATAKLRQLAALGDDLRGVGQRAFEQKWKRRLIENPRSDPRLESVVVIVNPAGSLGTGFYVAPDLVVTNFHVVEGAKYVDLKLYDDRESFGKVVANNPTMDLALVKVNEQGRPAEIYSGSPLELGATVEAIGHPRGLEFSITRGVVSALRRLPSDEGTGDDVLHIQTDAPINRGNSGGPLFLENQVVGVNVQKLVKTDIEGIGFAIHYAELVDFLEANTR
jgi:S1-C subfamily serine protease